MLLLQREAKVGRKEKREHRITNKECRISKGKNLLDSPVPGETGFAFHGAGKPGNDGAGLKFYFFA